MESPEDPRHTTNLRPESLEIHRAPVVLTGSRHSGCHHRARIGWLGLVAPIRNGMDSDTRMSKTGASRGQAQAEAPRAPRRPAGEVSIRCGAGGAFPVAGHHPLHQPARDHFDQRAGGCVAARALAGWTANARRGPLVVDGSRCGGAGADEVQVAGMQDGCAASYLTVTGDGDGDGEPAVSTSER